MNDGVFRPATGLGHRHIQTLLPTLLHLGRKRRWQHQELDLPDGDFVDLAWNRFPDTDETRPIVVLFHGLEGSVNSPYAQDMMQGIDALGWLVVLMHFRGCSGRPNRLARSYHSGETGDARFLLDGLRRTYPDAPLTAVGYSLGGNMLLKLQAELGEHSPLEAAVSISAPIRLDLCAERIRQGFSRVYQAHLLRRMKRNLLNKYALHDYKALIDLDRRTIHGLNDFWSFDDAYTAPIHGFRDVHDYYRQSSARQYLGAIRSPTLIIHAEDDPFMSPEVIPAKTELSESTQLQLCRAGGHVGFVEGSLLRPRYWLTRRVPDYLGAYLKT